MAALEAGKHVMCEKPMAINSEQALAMVEAAERTGKKLTIGYQNRFRLILSTLRSCAMPAIWVRSISPRL